METNKTKIAITDDQPLICDGMEKIINSLPDMEVIINLQSGIELLKRLATELPKPDIVLLDIDMPDMSGLDVLKSLKKEYPDIKVVMLSFHKEPYIILRCFEIGASAYIQKNEATQNIIATIKNVVTFGLHMSLDVQKIISSSLQNKKLDKNLNPVAGKPLTPKEISIVQLICIEKSNSEIANLLDISTRTVETHRAAIMKKIDVSSSTGLVLYAIKNGYFYPED